MGNDIEKKFITLPNGVEVELSLDNPLFKDFERIPATFDEFISNPYYLGKSWKNPWPFWKEQGEKFFPLPLRSPYSSLILLGATGVGKTSFAVNMVMAYYLHVVLCLKNPQEYFALEEQKSIVFAFINIVTKAIAYKNAWGMIHKALLKSPFFMEYGIQIGDKYPEWKCVRKPISLLYGRNSDDIIGLDILCCLTGDTEIRTSKGIEKLENLVNKLVQVETFNPITKQTEISKECKVVQTKFATELIEIELENGSVLQCTPEHKLLLKSGIYKRADELTEDDELQEGDNAI